MFPLSFPPAGRPSAGAHGPGPMGPGKISQVRSPRQGVLGKVSYAYITEKYAALAKNMEQPGDDDGDDDGRIFPERPSPILHAPRDNISRKIPHSDIGDL